jgi:formate hydrogenlyase subunit 3/multisubunit Na+/H+ antiporter MnhD subunit
VSAPVIWIIFPGVMAIALYAIRRWQRVAIPLAILLAAGLAWLAWRLPVGESIRILPFLPAIELEDTFFFLGRRLVIDNSVRPVLVLIYLSTAFWFGATAVARASRLFIPLGLGIAALLTAAQAVDPFLFAALLIEIAALVSVPILNPPGKRAGRGVMRFLTFQTLGMPFILFTGWMLERVETSPTDTALAVRAALMVALGLAFLMAVFPFYTWIPMLAEEANPYSAAFLFFILPAAVSIFALGLLEQYTWMRADPAVFLALRSLGTLMVASGGIWAAFQRHLGRILGYAATAEIGLSLLALSLSAPLQTGGLQPGGFNLNSLEIFFALLLPRSLGLAVWALALTAVQLRNQDLRFRSVQGLARSLPFASAGLVLAQFSLAGLPLLAGFPVRVALWSVLARENLLIALLVLLGNAGLLVGGVRTLVVLVMGAEEHDWHSLETWAQRAMLVAGMLALLVAGILPQWFLPLMASMAQAFGSAAP